MSEILKITDFNKGATLKQGDSTTLKYYLHDADEDNIESIIGSPTEVVFIKGDRVYYRTTGMINELFICEFKIEEVLPIGIYHIEFLVNGHIFPSMDKPYFTLTASSKGLTDQIITAHGFEEVVILALQEVENRSAERLSELESNYATRLVELETNDQTLTAQLAQTDGRIDNLIALPEGSTTNDARLEDIKIGADGNTYDSPAIAVRSQFSDVNYQLNNIAYKFGDVVSIAKGSDVASHNGTVSSFNSGNLIIDPDTATRAWRWMTFKDDSDRIEFEYTDTQYLILYEKDSKAVAVSLKNGKIIEFQPDSIVNINAVVAPEVLMGDTVRVTKDFVPENNRYNYKIEVKRVGSSSFEVWEDNISSKINYLTYIDGKNKTFGFVMYPSNVQNTVNKMKIIKYSGDSIEAKLQDLEIKIVHSLGRHNGKTLATIGDSMTMQGKYQPKIMSELGLSGHTSFAANGRSTVEMPPLKGWWGSANNSDLIVFFMGTNDFGQERDLGEVDSTDLNTTSGAVRSIMQEFSLPKFNGRTKLIVLSPQRWGYTSGTPVNSTMTNTKGITLWQYLDRIKTIAQEFGLPVLDLYHNLGVNKNNASYFLYDGLHPTDETYEKIGYMIAKKLDEIW